ncbi:hypothetical protein GFK91_23490 [Roseibium aggregatum]|uniref:hypothetical protein n=1 Tax=Roseibium aggregatum TaxID=187304 RepID=UPI001E61057F|nr:hypothetical protein [Roseibium aggregatum]UES58322.1 hypothetical protein GFK91_23490 [Roseibium aggregatum]
MNRKFSAEFSKLANLLTEADPLAARAVRAMVPDGLQKSVVSKNVSNVSNVITLHDDCAKPTRSGRAKCNEEGNAFAFPQPPVGLLAEAVEARHEQ